MIYRIIFILACWLIILPAVSLGLELEKETFSSKNFAGVRIGAWTNAGDEAIPEESEFSSEFSNSSVFAEFFYSHRIATPLAVEISLGIYSRGDVEYYSTSDVFVGAVNIYPIFVSAKLYPLYSFKNLPFYLYAQPGFGLVYASQSIIDYDDYYYYYYGYTAADSETKFTYSLGAGVEIPVATQIGLAMNFRYIPVKFGDPLAEIEDYSGWTLTVGAGYIF